METILVRCPDQKSLSAAESLLRNQGIGRKRGTEEVNESKHCGVIFHRVAAAYIAAPKDYRHPIEIPLKYTGLDEEAKSFNDAYARHRNGEYSAIRHMANCGMVFSVLSNGAISHRGWNFPAEIISNIAKSVQGGEDANMTPEVASIEITDWKFPVVKGLFKAHVRSAIENCLYEKLKFMETDAHSTDNCRVLAIKDGNYRYLASPTGKAKTTVSLNDLPEAVRAIDGINMSGTAPFEISVIGKSIAIDKVSFGVPQTAKLLAIADERRKEYEEIAKLPSTITSI